MPLLLQRHKTQNAKEVNFLNVLRGAGGVLPNLGTVLKGVIALADHSPTNTTPLACSFEKHAAAHPEHVAIRHWISKLPTAS